MEAAGEIFVVLASLVIGAWIVVASLTLINHTYKKGICERDNNVYECTRIYVPKERSDDDI